MVACLESGNYIQIRNALILLTKVSPASYMLSLIDLEVLSKIDPYSDSFFF